MQQSMHSSAHSLMRWYKRQKFASVSPIVPRGFFLCVPTLESLQELGTLFLQLFGSLLVVLRSRGPKAFQSPDCFVDAVTFPLKRGQNAFKVQGFPPSAEW